MFYEFSSLYKQLISYLHKIISSPLVAILFVCVSTQILLIYSFHLYL